MLHTALPTGNALSRAIAAAFLFGTMPVRAADTLAPVSEWSVRYAQMRDQKPEWDGKGYLPTYRLTWTDRERPELRIDDQPDGRCRGYVLAGREFRVPAKVPASVHAEFDYKTYCACNRPDFKRAGMVYFLLFTPEQWARFAKRPNDARKIKSWSAPETALLAVTVHRNREDVTKWTHASSGELRGVLRPYAGRRVVVALVWGAAHFDRIEWGAFRNLRFMIRTEQNMLDDFFESLDFTRPDLAAVKTAWDAGDIEAAKRALVRHMLNRTAPPPPILATRRDARTVAAADKIVDHVFRFVGCPEHKLGKIIRWNEDPFDYDQWAIALNRHYHWGTLGRAYAGTKDEKYAKEFVTQLTSWIDAMPVRIGRHYIEGITPEATLSLDAGIRMGRTWFPTYTYFLHSPSFSVEAHIAMLRSFRDHALYLMDPRHFRHGSNWGMMELNGLFHIGVMLPEFKDAAKWRRTAIERLEGELEYQFYPDGAQVELTPGYHGVSLGNALGVVDLAQHTHTPLPKDILGKLERAFAYYLRIMMPNGRTPALNDSGWGSVRGWLKRGFQYFPVRTDFEFAATAGKAGQPPRFTSCAFDYAGWYFMRSGWDAAARYLLFDAGPYGAGHQHEDKLEIIVHAFGRTVITEAGTYSYDASDWRRYVLSTRAHNTVLVDGHGQNRHGLSSTYRTEKPLRNRWITNKEIDYAEGSYRDGYGPQRDTSVTHTRRILFIKPRFWIVIDEMRPSDGKPHTYESLFHLDAPTAAVAQNTRVVTSQNPKGGNVAFVPLCPSAVQVEIVKGQKKPVVQGWLPTGRHNVLRPIPTAIVRVKQAGPVVLGYAIVPFEAGTPAPATSVAPLDLKAPGLAARLRFADGTTYEVGVAADASTRLRFAGHETDSRFVVLARPKDGAPEVVFQLENPPPVRPR